MLLGNEYIFAVLIFVFGEGGGGGISDLVQVQTCEQFLRRSCYVQVK